MLFRNIKILDENFDVKDNMYVATEGNRIAYIGTEMPEKSYGEVYDGKGKLLMPGFVNTHAHSPMTLMRGYGENYNLQDWLNLKIFPFEAHLDSEAIYWGTTLAMAESLRFGIVSSTDMYYFLDDIARAVKDAGARENISFAITQFDDSDPKMLSGFKEMENSLRTLHKAFDDRVRIDASIHAEYTSNPKTVEAVSAFAKENGINMHIHVSETLSEHLACKEKYGLTPVQYMEKHNALCVPATLAHCVHIEECDYEILKSRGVTVASNPISNLKLASGVCNVPRLLREGISVGIGTDSVASNNSLNFFEEMKVFAISSKMMYKDPTAVTPKETLYAATRAGALSQGRQDAGLLKEGFLADLIVLDVDKPNMHPVTEMVNNLVYSASGSDVVLTMVNGEVLFRDNEYKAIDVERVYREVENKRKEIISKI